MANKGGSKFSFGISKDSSSSSKQAQAKLKSFPFGKNVFRKQKEEKDAKKKSDELAAAKVFEEFKASFEDAGKGSKTFVRGQTINPDEPDKPLAPSEAGTLYNPASKLVESEKQVSNTSKQLTSVEKLSKKKEKEKKKSILELFREELKS